ncbi:hypothetical protein KB151_003875 [[Clostridium] innocuum]|nr:hypothetical protein [[Clostridium] innocuum]
MEQTVSDLAKLFNDDEYVNIERNNSSVYLGKISNIPNLLLNSSMLGSVILGTVEDLGNCLFIPIK